MDENKNIKKIIFVLLPRHQALDLNGPLQVFDTAIGYGANLDIAFCGLNSEVKTAQGLSYSNIRLYKEIVPQKGDYIFLPGLHRDLINFKFLNDLDSAFIAWLKKSVLREAIICSVCNATIIPAYAGLLDGKKCTSHWERFDQLQKMFPDIKVVRDVLFVKEQNVYSSAGIMAGIDLALSIVDDEFGPHFTTKVAKELVMYIRRSGSDEQMSPLLDHRNHINIAVHNVQDWLTQNFFKPHKNRDLAEIAHMSVRTLTRQFKAASGITINEFTRQLQIARAKELLENPNMPLSDVATHCGFNSLRHFRRVWSEETGSPPSVKK